jgi:hypothetical protein
MRKLMIGSLVAAGLVFAGCESRREEAFERQQRGVDIREEPGEDSVLELERPEERNMGGAGEQGIERDPMLDEQYRQDQQMRENQDFGGAGEQEFERDEQLNRGVDQGNEQQDIQY